MQYTRPHPTPPPGRNTINNWEKKKGVAVLGVLFVWASGAAAVAAFYLASPKAGLVLAPSAAWLTVAAVLVYNIWLLNEPEKNPLLPLKAA